MSAKHHTRFFNRLHNEASHGVLAKSKDAHKRLQDWFEGLSVDDVEIARQTIMRKVINHFYETEIFEDADVVMMIVHGASEVPHLLPYLIIELTDK